MVTTKNQTKKIDINWGFRANKYVQLRRTCLGNFLGRITAFVGSTAVLASAFQLTRAR